MYARVPTYLPIMLDAAMAGYCCFSFATERLTLARTTTIILLIVASKCTVELQQ